MRRKRSHWGSVIEIVPGKKYGIRWTESTPNGRVKPYETFYGTRRQAYDRKEEIHREVRERGGEAPTVTVGRAYESWYLPSLDARVRAGKLKPGTVDQYRAAWKRNIHGRWAGVPASAVRAIDIEGWLQGIPRASGGISKNVLSGVLDECVKRAVIPTNPARVKMVESALGTTQKKGAYTLEQLDAIAWSLRGSYILVPFALMAFGGCRFGESLGPKLEDVSGRECRGMAFAEVRIARQVRRDGAVSADEDLKNRQSVRMVYVPEPWCWPVLHAASNPKPGDVLLTDSGYGMAYSQGRVNEEWRRGFDEGALGMERLPLKNIRPSWQTWANWRNHIDRDKIEKLMGHVGRGVTMMYYDRPLDVQLMEEIALSFESFPYESPFPWRSEFGEHLDNSGQ